MIDYQERHPCAALDGVVLAYWRVTGDGTSVPSPMILPDAYVEIVINAGDPVMLTGSAFTGAQPERSVVGLLERGIEMQYGPRVDTIGIRLHCARAAAFLGVPASALQNTLSPLASLSPKLDQRLARASMDLDDILVEHLRETRPCDNAIGCAVDRLLNADAPVTVADLARDLAMSPRHLHRRFLAEVGTSPKQVERLARFARAWREATMGPPLTWAELALANGYADQSHLVREFRTFGAQPPANLFTEEWYDATNVSHVRSVQDHADSATHNERIKKRR